MIIAYEYRRISTGLPKKPNKIVHLDEIDQQILDTLDEQAKIEDVYKKLCKYLQMHSILPYDEAMPDYISIFVREEEMKRSAGAKNNDTVEHLKILLTNCRDEINLLKNTLEHERQSANPTELIDADDIFPLVATLYDFPINGERICMFVEELLRKSSSIEEREIFVQLPAKADSSELMLAFKHCMSKS